MSERPRANRRHCSAAAIPATMQAMVLVGPGDYDRYVLRGDVPVSVPGPGEVLVAVEAGSVNNTDVNVRTSWYDGEVEDSGLAFPRIQGADVVGRVVALGPGGDPALLERRVLCDPNLRSGTQRRPERSASSGLLGYDIDGGFAEYVRLPEVNVWPVPEELPAEVLAPLPVAYATALEMIVRSRPRPGRTMVVTGASGGVGAALVQFGKYYRLEVVAIAAKGKEERLRELGADLVVDRTPGNLVDSLREVGITAVDTVADVAGGRQLADLLDFVRPAGHVVTAGAISGAIAPIDLRHLIYKDIDLRGVAGTRVSTFATLVDIVSRGELRPPVAATFPLRDLVAAQQQFLERTHVGKIVVTVCH